MVKITTEKQTSPIVNKIAIYTGVLVFSGFLIMKITEKPSSTSIKTEKIESIVSKPENKLSVNEWKKIADYKAQEFYECTKDLDMDITKFYLYESCATNYNNNWVRFRDGLDERANLNYDQREMLKDYWHKTRDVMTEKVSNLMKENDKKLRPNRDN